MTNLIQSSQRDLERKRAELREEAEQLFQMILKNTRNPDFHKYTRSYNEKLIEIENITRHIEGTFSTGAGIEEASCNALKIIQTTNTYKP